MSEPLDKGIFVFKDIQESEGEDSRIITFDPPLRIEYTILEKIDKDTGKENYEEEGHIMGFAVFDFGMLTKIALDYEHNSLTHGYEGLTQDSPPQEVLMRSLMFDLFHAFCHPPEDPNYGTFHWALAGWLQDRATVKEID